MCAYIHIYIYRASSSSNLHINRPHHAPCKQRTQLQPRHQDYEYTCAYSPHASFTNRYLFGLLHSLDIPTKGCVVFMVCRRPPNHGRLPQDVPPERMPMYTYDVWVSDLLGRGAPPPPRTPAAIPSLAIERVCGTPGVDMQRALLVSRF